MLRISHKIIIAFVLMVFLFLAMMVLSLRELSHVRTLSLEIEKIHNTYTDTYVDLTLHIRRYLQRLDSIPAILDLDYLDNKERALSEDAAFIDAGLKSLKKYTDQFDLDIEHLQVDMMALYPMTENLLGLSRKFSQMQAIEFFHNQVQPMQADISEDLSLLNEGMHNMFMLQREQLTEKIHNIKYFMNAVFLSCCVIFIILGWWLWRGIISPMFVLKSYLTQPVRLHRLFRVPFLNRPDEIGDFSRSFDLIMNERDLIYQNLKDQTAEVIQAKNLADSANHAKSEFLANMSHELRTPLNSILGMIQILKVQKISEEQKDMFYIIGASADSLLKIVNDILDLSKIEAGKTELEHRPFDLHACVLETIEMLTPLASKKSVVLSLEWLQKEPLFVFGDSLRLSRILMNLVNNAIRYTQAGSVKVCCQTIMGTGQNHITFKVDVIDTGIGIADNQIHTIFDKFTQADNSATRRYGGTGLGLSITKELVEMMKGDIHVSSILGLGSTFSFYVVLDVVQDLSILDSLQDEAHQDHYIEAFDGIPIEEAHILLVEDQPMNVAFMKKFFMTLGVGVYRVAENGRQALDILAEEDFDLILMDCHMPIMNGYDTTRAIRQLRDQDKATIPIVALTANLMQDNIDQCLQAGMDAHVGKPFDLKQFEATLSRWLVFKPLGTTSETSDSKSGDGVHTKRTVGSADNEETGLASSVADEEGGELSPVDLTNLRENAMGDEAFVKEMVGMFVTQGEEQLQALAEICQTEDHQAWVEVSHALKGTAAGVGAETMRLLCARAQDMKPAKKASYKALHKAISKE